MRDWHVYSSTGRGHLHRPGRTPGDLELLLGRPRRLGERGRTRRRRTLLLVRLDQRQRPRLDEHRRGRRRQPDRPVHRCPRRPADQRLHQVNSPFNIDPTVFTDDDGQVYMYWGSYYGLRAVRLNADMTSTRGSVVTPQRGVELLGGAVDVQAQRTTVLPGSTRPTTPAAPRRDTPASGMRPRATRSVPWTHRGVVLDMVSSTTNHPAIIEAQGRSGTWSTTTPPRRAEAISAGR